MRYLFILILTILNLNLFSQRTRIDSTMVVDGDTSKIHYTWFKYRQDGVKIRGVLRVELSSGHIQYGQLTISNQDVFYWSPNMKSGRISSKNGYYYLHNDKTSALSIKQEDGIFKPILFLKDISNPYLYIHFKYKQKIKLYADN